MSRWRTWFSKKHRSLTEIPLPGEIWFASDIHLGPHTPATQAAFHAFLERAGASADALLLCGDIFDVWIGDDVALSAPPPWLSETLGRLGRLAQSMPLWLGRGNRDFLMGEQLARHLGARILPDTCRLRTDFGDILLSHGDEYCLDDAGYRRFRRIVRNPAVQALFLSLSLERRGRIAAWARSRSMASNQYKPTRIMDVTPRAIEQAFEAAGVDTMVHGHTHRPAVHSLTVGGKSRRRIVLPDWDYDHGPDHRGGGLIIDRRGPRLIAAPARP